MQTAMNTTARPIYHRAWFSPAQARQSIIFAAQVVRHVFTVTLAGVAWFAISLALGGTWLAYLVIGVCIVFIITLIQALIAVTVSHGSSGPSARSDA